MVNQYADHGTTSRFPLLYCSPFTLVVLLSSLKKGIHVNQQESTITSLSFFQVEPIDVEYEHFIGLETISLTVKKTKICLRTKRLRNESSDTTKKN